MQMSAGEIRNRQTLNKVRKMLSDQMVFPDLQNCANWVKVLENKEAKVVVYKCSYQKRLAVLFCDMMSSKVIITTTTEALSSRLIILNMR